MPKSSDATSCVYLRLAAHDRTRMPCSELRLLTITHTAHPCAPPPPSARCAWIMVVQSPGSEAHFPELLHGYTKRPALVFTAQVKWDIPKTTRAEHTAEFAGATPPAAMAAAGPDWDKIQQNIRHICRHQVQAAAPPATKAGGQGFQSTAFAKLARSDPCCECGSPVAALARPSQKK
jgi:hypothetical protein